MKKIILGLTSVMGISISTTAIVSCGITFDVLTQRKIDTNEFKGYFQYNPTSLVSAKTMNAQDFELISDLNVPLVTVDQFGRTVGELAVKFNPAYGENEGDQFVGNRVESEDENGHESWTYLINKKAVWVDFNSKPQGQITGNDFLNIFLYIAHPNTASETKSFWSSYIYGANDLINYIDNGIGKKDDEEPKEEPIVRYKKVYDQIKTKGAENFDGMEPMRIDGKDFYLGIKTGTVEDLSGKNIPSEYHPGRAADLFDDQSYYVTFYGPDGIPLPFFDSLMTYASFAPVPNRAVEFDNSQSFSSYMTTENYKTSAWFSGPFVLKNIQLSQSVEYVRNEHYANIEDVHFKKMIKTYKAKASDGEIRTSFEAGDLSEIKLRPTDPQGWNQYVGSNILKPEFSSITIEGSKQKAPYGIYINPINRNLWKPESQDEAEINTRILSSSLVRQYIMTTIQKSWMSKYYSKAFDKVGDRHKSATTINTLMPVDFSYDEDKKDYIDYLAEEIKADSELENIDATTVANALKPGEDFFSKHDTSENPEDNKTPIGYNIIRGIDEEADENEQLKMDQAWIKTVKDEVAELAGKDTMVTLNHLTNGARANTENRYIQNMIDIFNRDAKDDGINIRIIQDQTNDESEFKTKRLDAAYDLLITGWSPDFVDPVSFLKTQTLNGDLANYFGLHRMIDATKTDAILEKYKELNKINEEQEDGEETPERINIPYETLRTNGWINTSYIPTSKETEDQISEYVSAVSEYTVLIDKAAADSNLKTRFEDFAKAEKMLLMDESFTIPIYDPWVLPSVKLSFVRPFHYSTVGYGSSQYVHRGWELLPTMPDKARIKSERAAYDNYKKELPNSGICFPVNDGNGNFEC